jgi:DNA-binding transcriptional MerR regulator
MSSYRISEAAARTGFTAPTLRYYEDIGLIPAAARAESGYRLYDDRGMERLAFIAQAKRLGLNLDAVRELTTIRDGDECAPVQRRMAELIADRLARTQDQLADLTAFERQLQAVADRLSHEPGSGPCNEACPCEAGAGATPGLDAVEFTPPGNNEADAPVVCTLEAGRMSERSASWQELVERATAHETIDGGVRLTFPNDDPDLAAALARLASLERQCCAWFDFGIRIASGGLTLEVRGPAAAAGIVTAMFGAIA